MIVIAHLSRASFYRNGENVIEVIRDLDLSKIESFEDPYSCLYIYTKLF